MADQTSNLESSVKRVTSVWHCEACLMVHEFVGPTAFTLHGFRCWKCGHDNFIVKQPETSPTLVWQCCDVWYGPAREACPICKTPRGAVITAATRRQAPWNDFSGNTIFEGDEIVHPTGERGRVLYVEGCTYPNDAWRVDYADGGPAGRLCLQTGDKGRAVVAAKAAPEEPPPNLGPREPDNDMVICPNCTNQFPAMSVNAQKERSQAEKDLTQALEERDGYHAYADQLTAMIGVYFETDHGEHSNLNDPWENAIETMRVKIGLSQEQVRPSPPKTAALPADTTVVQVNPRNVCKKCGGLYADWCACSPPEVTDSDARDAARYRWMREPQNLIVYAKSRNAWGTGGSGHIRYDTAEQLDAAIDAERGAAKPSA